LLLYVTAHYDFPKTDLEEAVARTRDAGGGPLHPDPATDIYWVSWRELHTLLVRTGAGGFLGYVPGEQLYLEDLREVLALRRLREFQPFQGLVPVAAYERVLERPAPFERLLPVQPYQAIREAT
jgi:hypothetical protein